MTSNPAQFNRAFVVNTIKDLPPFSSAINDVLTMLDENRADMSKVAEKLLVDPILAGRVLHMANSSFYGFSRQIGSVREACVILGNHTVKNLVYTLAVMGQFEEAKKHAENPNNKTTITDNNMQEPVSLTVDYNQVWRHSLMVGCLAMKLAESVKYDPVTAYTAGLFQELGMIILHYFFPDKFLECSVWAQKNNVCLIDAERKFFGIDHFQVSALGLDTWHFPNTIVDVLSQVSDLSNATTPIPYLLRVCDVMATGMGEISIDGLPLMAVDDKILENSHIDITVLEAQLTPGRKLFSDLSKQLIA